MGLRLLLVGCGGAAVHPFKNSKILARAGVAAAVDFTVLQLTPKSPT